MDHSTGFFSQRDFWVVGQLEFRDGGKTPRHVSVLKIPSEFFLRPEIAPADGAVCSKARSHLMDIREALLLKGALRDLLFGCCAT